METISKFAQVTLASCGIGAIQATTAIPAPDQITEIMKLALQIIIAATAIIAMFRKKKSNPKAKKD
jgi:hypothetical protein